MPHLCCGVCLAFPEAEVLQCYSGHILCKACYDRVCHSEKPTCPTCRETLDVVKPIRNMLAERSIAMLPVKCPNEGCDVKLVRGTLQAHLKSECPLRVVECKYSSLGCKWVGTATELVKHEDNCKRKDQPGWKLLKKVNAAREADRASHASELASARVGQRVCEILTSRCRNIEFTTVPLHKCSSHEHVSGKPAHMVSHTFLSIGFRWKVYTVANSMGSQGGSAEQYSVVLNLRDWRAQPLPAEFFILRGEPIDADVKIATGAFSFDGKKRMTEPLLLAEGPSAAYLEGVETFSLRIGLIDKRAGRPCRSFLGFDGGAEPYHPDYGTEEDWGEHDEMSSDGNLPNADASSLSTISDFTTSRHY